MTLPDPRPAPRVKDRHALARGRLLALRDGCAACGRPAGSVHHVIPRSEGGDDVAGNLLGLCGTGDTGCHGAWHGNAYVVTYRGYRVAAVERRTAEWVAVRIGRTIERDRRDVIAYVLDKLGVAAGRAYLERRYQIEAA